MFLARKVCCIADILSASPPQQELTASGKKKRNTETFVDIILILNYVTFWLGLISFTGGYRI